MANRIIRGIGIQVHQSKFSVLAQESSSDSEDGESWETVKGRPSSNKSKTKKKEKADDSPNVSHQLSKAAMKNAKRRAKKRNTNQNGKENEESAGYQLTSEWQTNDELLVEKEFQKDLSEALLLSLEDKEREKKDESTESSVKTPKKAKTKKVTMSLQELHQMDTTSLSFTDGGSGLHSTKEPLVKESDVGDFFDTIESEVQSEMKKEKQKKRLKEKNSTAINGKKCQSTELFDFRIAQLQDDLESKNELIQKLKEENKTIKVEMNEVKVRNQVLCKMLSRGEFSTKSELLQQIEELSTDNADLTTELERLHRELEQEKSKSKALSIEIAKLQDNNVSKNNH